MVVCPKGTPSQVKANLSRLQRPTTFSFDSNFFSWVYDPVKDEMVFVGEKESQISPPETSESELDSNKADKRSPPTPRDELVYFFISFFLDILLESWEGKPCTKSKIDKQFPQTEEFYGELEEVPCKDSLVHSTVDFLRDMYRRRSSRLSKDKSSRDSKTKKSSKSNESEYLNAEDFQSSEPTVDQWGASVPDEDVYCVFSNGVWYKGRVSRRLMDGDGTYFWEDGSTFQGEFESGCATGKGRLEFPDLSVYEGDVYKSFRHGEGMQCFSNSHIMYSGQWWLGKKHGYGLIVYNDPSKELNFYRGHWQDGVKEGFGFRQYPSGAKYIGFWSNGQRHGKGVMLWSNHDIYRGQWKEGYMHGYGEYTWNGFINKFLSYPATNTYRGYWSEGKRCGRGVFEAKNGTFIETVWVDNLKEGPGAVICYNGSVVAAECLFHQDKPALFNDQEDKTGLLLRDQTYSKNHSRKKGQNEEHLLSYLKSMERAKAISIPVHSSVQSLSLCPHTHKYYLRKKDEILNEMNKSVSDFQMIRFKSEQKSLPLESLSSIRNLPDEDENSLSKCVMEEGQYLRNFVKNKITNLKACYDYYATLSCKKSPSFKCIMVRLFLWQMLIDAEIFNSNLSLVDVDKLLENEDYLLIENPHDPFERIQFWQFIHIVIVLSWYLYGQYVFDVDTLNDNAKIADFLQFYSASECKNVLKIALEFFLEKDIFRGRFCGNFNQETEDKTEFQESDYAPMEAMYLIYRDIGEPHSARDFVYAICNKRTHGTEAPIIGYFEKLPFYKVEGKNAFTVAGELHHISEAEPFNFPQIFDVEKSNITTSMSILRFFSNLKAKQVIKCLAVACPGITRDDFITNMAYQLTFLEFYKAIILCTELTLKIKVMNQIRGDIIQEHKAQMEEYRKLVSENEKLKEEATVSRKKSRQLSDYSRRGRK